MAKVLLIFNQETEVISAHQNHGETSMGIARLTNWHVTTVHRFFCSLYNSTETCKNLHKESGTDKRKHAISTKSSCRDKKHKQSTQITWYRPWSVTFNRCFKKHCNRFTINVNWHLCQKRVLKKLHEMRTVWTQRFWTKHEKDDS